MKYLLLIIASATIASCEPLSIEGRVSDDQLKHVKSATVTLKRTGLSTTTDHYGTFILNNLQPYDSIIVTKQGYEPTTEELVFGRRNRIHVMLKKVAPAKP